MLCTGRQVDDAKCVYLADVQKSRQPRQLGDLRRCRDAWGGTSWLDCRIVENFAKVNFSTDYPYWEVVQRLAFTAATSGTQAIVEVPPESQIAISSKNTSFGSPGSFCTLLSWAPRFCFMHQTSINLIPNTSKRMMTSPTAAHFAEENRK